MTIDMYTRLEFSRSSICNTTIKQWPRLLARPLWLAALLASTGSGLAQYSPLPVVVTEAVLSDHLRHTYLVGEVVAKFKSDLAFQIDGEVVERLVEVGDIVSAGQPLARLDNAQQEADLDAAVAAVTSAFADVTQASAALTRETNLLAQGLTTRRQYDDAVEADDLAHSTLDSAEAAFQKAKDASNDAILRTEATGVVTSVAVEPGQVVRAGAVVFTIATEGPLDAIFDVDEAVLTDALGWGNITVQLYDQLAVSALAKLRQVSPTVDPTTGAVQVKLSLLDPPLQMTLGSVVRADATYASVQAVVLPSTAMFSDEGKPAVWVVDAGNQTVSLRKIELDSYESDQIVVTGGVEPGDLVVVRGASLLHPGQNVLVQQDVVQ